MSPHARSMNSLEKMLSLLDVFTLAAPVWSTEDLIRYSGCSRSTCYRYIKALQSAGFLTPVANGSYILGPRIIELDRHIRMCDPVYTAGGPPMQRLGARTGDNALLCMLFSDTVICVREELNSKFPALAKTVMEAAQEATERIGSGEHGVDLPARAVG